MTTGIAQVRRIQLEPRVQRDLGRRSGEVCSKYIAELIEDLDAIESVVRTEWDHMEPAMRYALHAMVLGVPSKRTLAERWQEFLDHFSMLWAIIWHGAEVRRYIARSYGVAELIQERIGRDVWAETLASPEHVAAVERGMADVLAGRTVELSEP
jgi:hypothetical protein